MAKQHRASSVLHFSHTRAADLANKVLDYVDSPDDQWSAAFWPLVKKVRISGPPSEEMPRPPMPEGRSPWHSMSARTRLNGVNGTMPNSSAV